MSEQDDEKKPIWVMASGSRTGGGSGFENLVRRSKQLDYRIQGVISNIRGGGVEERAKLQIVVRMQVGDDDRVQCRQRHTCVAKAPRRTQPCVDQHRLARQLHQRGCGHLAAGPDRGPALAAQ